MSHPHSSSKTQTLTGRVALFMLLVAVLACILVIIQSCSYKEKPGLMRFARGSLHKLQVLPNPPPAPALVFRDKNGLEVRLSDFKGRLVLLNVWASWCPPCVREMPSLDGLQAARGGQEFTILAVTLDNNMEDPQRFYKRKNIRHLDLYQDPSISLTSQLGVKSIPISVLYDRNGHEIARIPGEVDWQSQEVDDLLDAVLPSNSNQNSPGAQLPAPMKKN